jgi:hypothetical protein
MNIALLVILVAIFGIIIYYNYSEKEHLTQEVQPVPAVASETSNSETSNSETNNSETQKTNSITSEEVLLQKLSEYSGGISLSSGICCLLLSSCSLFLIYKAVTGTPQRD